METKKHNKTKQKKLTAADVSLKRDAEIRRGCARRLTYLFVIAYHILVEFVQRCVRVEFMRVVTRLLRQRRVHVLITDRRHQFHVLVIPRNTHTTEYVRVCSQWASSMSAKARLHVPSKLPFLDIKLCLHLTFACASASASTSTFTLSLWRHKRTEWVSDPFCVRHANANVKCKHLHLVSWIPIFTHTQTSRVNRALVMRNAKH